MHLCCLFHFPKALLQGGVQTKICLCCSTCHLSFSLGLLQRRGTQSQTWENHLSASSNAAFLGKPGKELNAPKPGYLEDLTEVIENRKVSLQYQSNPLINKPSSPPQYLWRRSLQTYPAQYPVVLVSCSFWSFICTFCSVC